mgnify:CR=1 FL=1
MLYIKCPDEELQALYAGQASEVQPCTARAERTDTHEHWFHTPRDTGFDLFTPIANVIPASATVKINLGISVAAYEEIRSDSQLQDEPLRVTTSKPLALFLIVRSSTGTKTPLRQANAPGLIDQGYRGNIMAAVDNTSSQPFTASMHSRLFQLMACDGVPFDEVRFVDDLSATDRGTGGFGSTGQ